MKPVVQILRERALTAADYLETLNREVIPVLRALRELVNNMAAAPEADVSTAGIPNLHFENIRFASITVTSNAHITLYAPPGADLVVLRVVQDATGGRTPPWGTGVFWPGGTPPTLSIAPFAVDIFMFYTDGTNFYGSTLGLDYQ